MGSGAEMGRTRAKLTGTVTLTAWEGGLTLGMLKGQESHVGTLSDMARLEYS